VYVDFGKYYSGRELDHMREVARRLKKIFGCQLTIEESVAVYEMLVWIWEFPDGFRTDSDTDIELMLGNPNRAAIALFLCEDLGYDHEPSPREFLEVIYDNQSNGAFETMFSKFEQHATPL
jgi:hypothetical protein